MTAIDYSAVLEDLREKRAAIDLITEGIARLAGGRQPDTAAVDVDVVDAPRRRLKPAKKKQPALRLATKAAAPTRSGRPRRSKVDEAVLARARKIAERDGLPAAADATGVAYSTLYSIKNREKWTVANGNRTGSTTSPAAAKNGKRKARVCTRCFQNVTANPSPCCGAESREA